MSFPDQIISLLAGESQLGLVMSGCHFCLDFDNEQAYQKWCEVNPALKHTTTGKTPAGYHVLFRVTDENYAPPSGKGPNVSIIADGWYIAVCPSLHPSGQQYKWLTYPAHDSVYVVQNVDVVLNGIDTSSIKWNVDDYREYSDDDDEWGYS